MSAEAVKVAVRVRPFNGREKEQNSKCIIKMKGPITTIVNPEDQQEKEFAFDFSYWSHDGFETDDTGYNESLPGISAFGATYASQKTVYDNLGVSMLNNAWDGYNCTMFAYGQTGAGKSYSFVGYGVNKGIMPLACTEIFGRIRDGQSDDHVFQVSCAMMEIYGRELRDLLNPKTKEKLKIRNGKNGTYVQGLKKMAVGSYAEIEKVQDIGTANRTVGATLMNATSSRAHTIVTISLTQLIKEDGRTKEMSSDIVLVDLAGSERAESTGATGARLQEGIEINVSLSALGNVISALAEKANNPGKKVFIPYRSHVLTELLQSALGGNSKTVMVAAVSPASINFDESLSTLRYADRAKQIKVVVEIMENPTDKLIRELKAENEKLKKMLVTMQGGGEVDLSGMDAPSGDADSGPPPPDTLTEEDLTKKIAEAVSSVEGVSEADKEKALAEVDRQLNSRSEALRENKLTPEDMQILIVSAINSVEGVSDYSKADAIVEAQQELERLGQIKSKDGGKIGPEDALGLVNDALDMWDTTMCDVPSDELQAAMDLAAKLLDPAAQVWADGVLSSDELQDVMTQAIVPLKSATVEDTTKAVNSVMYHYEGERQAALGNMTSKAVMIKAVRAAVSLLGTDGANSADDFQQINKAVAYAEMAFDQMQLHADMHVVNGESANQTLEKVMAMLGGNPAAIEAAKKAASAAISSSLSTGEGAEGAQRAAIAQQLGRNMAMMDQLTQGAAGMGDLNAIADEMGVSTMSRQELIMLCSSQREEVLTIREQNDELWERLAELESEVGQQKAVADIAKAKAKPGGMEEQLEQMAAFANQLQVQLESTEKERDAALAKANISNLVGKVAASKAQGGGGAAAQSKACAIQ